MNDQSRSAQPSDPQVEAALHEYLERVDRGEPVDREEFLAGHAPIADELRSFLVAEDELRKLAGPETPLGRAHDSTKSFVGHGQETLVPQSVGKRTAEAGGTGLTGQFGRYRIIRALGRGAMGTVYLAEDTQLQRSVALKTPHFTETLTEESLERFYREARVAATLRHTNICPVFDVGQIDGKHYISMAYIEGRSLSAFIQPDKPQSERQILLVIRKLALALQAAHDKGIVHRDLKPANIMVDTSSEPIIMDFGLARQVRLEGDVRLTQTGNIIGTPAYMSPEQVEGEPDKIGPSTDQYSLGVILYELLTAQLPFRGSVAAVMGQILTKQVSPPSQSRSALDPRIEAVCLRMMAKTPSERFASTKAVADELAIILKSPAAKATSGDKPASSPALPSAGDRLRTEASTSQVLKSIEPKAVTESDLASLEELARKCLARRDYDQVIQIVERIPDEKRNAALQTLLEKARSRADEISFLLCDIDEAVRLEQFQTAFKKAEALLKIKPGHHRGLEIQEQYGGEGDGEVARLGPKEITQAWSEGGWVPWSALAFGLAVVGVVCGLIIIWLGKTAIVIDATDPGITVEVKGLQVYITVPGEKSIKVEPGDQEIRVSYAGLETQTRKFTLKKGQTQRLTVGILNSQLVARLANEIAPLTSGNDEKSSRPTASGKSLLPPLTPAHDATATATLPPTFKNSLGMEFVLVPKGKSWLGGGGGKPGDKEVVMAHDFYLGKYEVTQEEWEKVTGLKPSGFSRTGGRKDAVKDIADAELKRFPVEQVSWDDAQLFLDRLNKLEQEAGWVYRLPKEAEWEYACRGGPLSDKLESAYDRYFDRPTNELLSEQANFGFDQGLKRPCKVGSYKPNRLSLYDMHGNINEWCDDAEKTAEGATLRVDRGGSWFLVSGQGRTTNRYALPASFRANDVGLRVARVLIGRDEVVKTPAEEKKPADVVSNQSPGTELLDAIMQNCRKKIGCSGATLTIARGDQILYSRGYGSSDREGKVPIQADTPMCIAACDMPFTAAAVRQLAQEGKLDLNASVLKLLKIKPARRVVDRRVWDITINHLLEHRAGWQGEPLDRAWKAANGKKHPIKAETLLAYVMCERLASTPGTKDGYDAFGFNTLKRVVARVSGRSYIDYLRYELCRPHGIKELKWIRDAGPGREGEPPRVWNGLIMEDPEEYRMGVSTPAMCRFMQYFWINGKPRGDGNPLWVQNGGWSNSTSSMIWRSDGINVAWSFNGAAGADPGQALWLHAIDQLKKVFESKPNVPTTAAGVSARPFLDRGEWTIENDELVQPNLATGDEFHPLLAFGEESLSNYDLTLEAEKTGGRHALGIQFHWLGPAHYREFSLIDNGRLDLSYRYNGKWGREETNSKALSYSSNQWYSLKVEARGDTFRAYLDGVLQFEQTDARFTHGRICVFTLGTAARFRRIKISDPEGKVLFEGLPELPPASNNTTPNAIIGNSSRLLTAGESTAKSAQQKLAERLKTPVISTNSLGIKLALIPPGEFTMGSPQSESRRGGYEQQHRVRITKPFYLGVYEITQSEFEQVMGRNPSDFLNSGGQTEVATGVDTSRYPVDSVTWYEAIEFCNKLSEKEGRQAYYRLADIEREGDGSIKEATVSVAEGGGYRLPTEAQWEYACRAGTTTPFSFGAANNGAESNCNGLVPYGTEEQGPALGRPVPVGSYRPNAFGLYDMHGNVWEWCWDVFGEYQKNPPQSDPAGPSGTPKVVRKKSKLKNSLESDPEGLSGGSHRDRVNRGGCFSQTAGHSRAAGRGWSSPVWRSFALGFRVARGSGE